ncbi:hypothetical protein BJY52DRAFT_1230224 [Lactarius psammicola]|nr:hypothetical protein BJY52DRAFT_1230224 [Lactarius psammicola]
MHGLIVVIAKEWKITEDENCSPDVGKLSVKAVDKSLPLGAHQQGQGTCSAGCGACFCSTAACKKHSTVESTGDSDKTASHAVAPTSHRVVVKSPPEAHHPKQHLHISEDSQATKPVLFKEQDSGASEGLWVSRGKDQCEECKLFNETLCVPQWGATKACTYCAGHKRSCHPTKEWLRQVNKLHSDRVRQHKDAADTGLATHCHCAPKKQPSPQAVANQDTHMAALEESIQKLTESHKKLMGHLGIKVTMPDNSTAFAIAHSTASSIPSPLVDDHSALIQLPLWVEDLFMGAHCVLCIIQRSWCQQLIS